MSFQGSYELLLNQQQAFQNIQAEHLMKSLYCGQPQNTTQHLFPGFQTIQNGIGDNLVHAAGHIPNLLQTQQVPASRTSTSSLQSEQKKFRPPQKSQKYIPKPIPLELGNLKTYSNPDILICGNCRDLFEDLVDMLDHKKNHCKMRFTCKCDDKDETCSDHDCLPRRATTNVPSLGSGQSNSKGKRVCLRCSQCKETFTGAWDLMFHVQNTHCINIYTLHGQDKKNMKEEKASVSQNIQDNPSNNLNELFDENSPARAKLPNH